MFGTGRGFIWRPFKGCKYDTTYIFTKTTMFGSSVIFILSTLPPVFGYAILMAAIFDFSQIRTSVILMSTLVVLPDLESMDIAVGMSLLLRTQPKTQVLYMYFRFMAAILIFGKDFCHLLFALSTATLLS